MRALPRSDWFDAERCSQRNFRGPQSFRPLGGTSYEAIGTLTIRNVTRQVVVPMTIEVNGTPLHASGKLDLVRTDYGVGQGTWTSGQWVALEVVVEL